METKKKSNDLLSLLHKPLLCFFSFVPGTLYLKEAPSPWTPLGFLNIKQHSSGTSSKICS